MTAAAIAPVPCQFASIIVPTHGRRDMLARLLESLCVQDWPAERYEIIVVHNFTPDGTAELVAEMAAGSPVALRYFRADFTRPGPSRQHGAERARGDVLAFIDDDCVAAPGWLAAGIAAVAGGLAVVQGRTLPNPTQPRRLLEHTVVVTGPTPFFETCNIFYAAAAFRAVGGFPAEFRAARAGEDTSLGWAVRQAGYATGFSAEAVAYHEVHPVSYLRWVLHNRIFGVLPFLVRRYPGFRSHMFCGVFYSRLTAAFDCLVLGAFAALLLHPACAVLCLPYPALRLVEPMRHRGAHFRVLRLLFGLPASAMISWSLLVGSARARCLVL